MGEYEYNLVDGCICTAETTKVSPSGKWIATTYRKEEVGSDGFIAYVQRPAFYNTETENDHRVEDYGEATGMHVTETASPSSASARCSSPRQSLRPQHGYRPGNMADWVAENYGIIIPGGVIEYISADGRYIFGTSVNALGSGFDDWYIAPPLQ